MPHTFKASAPNGYNIETSSAVAFSISGSATREVRVTRIRLSSFHTTAAGVLSMVCKKWSTAPTGGSTVAFTLVPNDSLSPAATVGQLVGWDSPPTDGTLVGEVGIRRVLIKNDTVVDGAAFTVVEFDFRKRPIILRGTNEILGVAWGSVPALRIAITPEVEWIEY